MNKKYLNAILFGAMALSTVAFTGCKDYDDDIDALNERVDAVEQSILALRQEFGTLAYVSGVTYDDATRKLTVTTKGGTTQTYTISDADTKPGADMNTEYELKYTVNGNSTTITLCEKSTGKSCGEVTITDTDTQNAEFDPTSLFVKNENGQYVVCYGDPEGENKQTGVTIPVPASLPENVATMVAVTDEKTKKVIGYTIISDAGSTTLMINDVLPISSVSFIPEVYYDGIEAVEFSTYNFNVWNYTSATAADTTYTQSSGASYYSEAPGVAKYYVNPASASENQIASIDIRNKTAVNKSTKSVEKSDIKVDIEKDVTLGKGELSVTIHADMTNADNGKDGKFDMFAINLTTKAGDEFTTPYFAAVRASEEAEFTLKDTEETPKEFNKKWTIAKGLNAIIDANGLPSTANSLLVQVIPYSKAIEGVDLNDYIKVYMGDTKIEADELAAKNLKITYVPCKDFSVEGTNQLNYMTLEGSTLTGKNYGGQEKSLIGKTPIIKAFVSETTNKVKSVLTGNNEDAVVAVAYVKFLYVSDPVEVAAPYYSQLNEKSYTWDGCVKADDIKFSTDEEYMSTKVYTLTGNEDGLDALPKKTFTTVYKLDPNYDMTDVEGVAATYSKEVTVEEGTAKGNADNRIVTFSFTEDQLKALDKAINDPDEPQFEFTFYAVYAKQEAYADPSSQYAAYPEIVAIPYTLKIGGYPTDGKAKANISSYRKNELFDADGYAVCKGSKFTEKGAVLALDLNEALKLTDFEAALYANSTYRFELDEETVKTGAAKFDDELCNESKGTGTWVILTKELKNNETATVTVKVYEMTCPGTELDAGEVKIKFYNPAVAELTKNEVVITDVNGNATAALNTLLKISSAKDNTVLYQNGAVVEANKETAKNILGANPAIKVEKVAASPAEYAECFTLGTDNKVTWSLNGQNSIAEGKSVTCQFKITLTYGDAEYKEVIKDCTETTTLAGCKWEQIVTVKVINPNDAK